MQRNFEGEFKKSIDALRFSSEDKERLCQRLTQHPNTTEREVVVMKKWSAKKVAAVAVGCLMVTGVTAFAASRISYLESWSSGKYDYVTVDEMNDAGEGAAMAMPTFPDTLGGSFTFDGGNTVHTAGKDEGGSTVASWENLHATYKDENGTSINVSLSPYVEQDGETRTHTQTRTIEGIEVTYDYDEYLFLPPDAENEEMDAETKARMENDDHFFVSYGSEEAETVFYSGVSFVKDGVSYYIYSSDEVSGDTLFSIAEELIQQ